MTMKAGVYRITNTINGNVYVGGSLLVRRRLGHHRSLLRRGRHFNAHLQRAWDLHGEAAFAFEVVEFCRDGEVLLKEQALLDATFGAMDRQSVYNVATEASAPGTGRKPSAETRRKMSESNRGKTRSEETRERMRQAQRGRTVSAEHRANISRAVSGVKHHRYGKPMPPEVSAKISASQRGKPRPTESVRKMTETRRGQGKLTPAIVRSMRERFAAGEASQNALAREHGVTSGLVCRIINNKTWVM